MKFSRPKKRTILTTLVVLFLVYGLLVLWPVRSFILPLLSGKTLLVLTNEAEARPCGGFASVYGIASILPPKAELKNVYALAEKDFGNTSFPLNKVSPTKKFWDAGIDADLETCTEAFKQHYQYATDEHIENVLLLNFQTLEEIIRVIGPVKFEEQSIDHTNVFSALSRSVADVDRHNEAALAKRKSPLSTLGKKIIFKSIFNPFAVPKVTRIIKQQEQNGGIYLSNTSESYAPEANDFWVSEWNLGGGKSSRYLDKEITISGREIAIDKWQWRIGFTADHLGSYDEPLSQDWKGVFEFHFPQWLGQPSTTEEATIKPGETYSKGFIFDTDLNTEINTLGIFTPRGQTIHYTLQLSAFGQQSLSGKNLIIKENTARTQGTLSANRKSFEFNVASDTHKPFVTLHTIVPKEVLNEEELSLFEEATMMVEVHTNEDVVLSDTFSSTLKDSNHTLTDISDDPQLVGHSLRPDKHTLLLGFNTTEKQLEERYTLTLTGIEDAWGNQIDDKTWTVIDRVQ